MIHYKKWLFRKFLDYLANSATPKKFRNRQYIIFKEIELLKEKLKMKNALILYHSKTGNTEKVAFAIKRGLEKTGFKIDMKKIAEVNGDTLYDYDLVCFGSPVYHSLPPPPVFKFIKQNDNRYRKLGEVRLSSPKLLNKNAIVFCTYSGPHCGIEEAIPTGKYLCQFFAHLGFDVKAEWYEVGEFHEWRAGSVKGRLGDIRGRPNEEDLALVELKTIQLVKSL